MATGRLLLAHGASAQGVLAVELVAEPIPQPFVARYRPDELSQQRSDEECSRARY